MNGFRSGVAVAFATALASAQCLAAPPVPSADPLAAIDLDRAAIIADIVQGFDGDRVALAKRLAGLRADRLLSASLASTRGSLETILGEAEKSRDAAAGRVSAKAFGFGSATTDLVYTPLTPCRLFDTRNAGAPIQGGFGIFAPNERRSYAPNGLCGLPTTRVASILVSVTTENLTPNSGGYLALLAPGAPVTTSVDIFNLGSEWSATSTVVSTGSASQFDVLVAVANAHVIVDVLGYFAPPNIFNIDLPKSTAAMGSITKEGVRFIHNFGSDNTFLGEGAGNFDMTGFANTASGAGTLAANTVGSYNTATGFIALAINDLGQRNTATGAFALGRNVYGSDNTAQGVDALSNNRFGSANTAFGVNALSGNYNGNENVAVGQGAGGGNTGSNNTAIGSAALSNNQNGNSNIAVGMFAGQFLVGDFNIAIGNQGVVNDNNTIRIGDMNQARTFIAGIRGVATGAADAVPVVIDSAGQLGTVSSSRRFKDDIVDMDASSSALMKLRPVTFHYKSDTNATGRTLQYGLIAEEVAKVYPGLVARSADGQIETVMYQYLPSMLLNELQKQQRVIEAQAQQIAEIERERQEQASDIAALKQQSKQMAAALDRLVPVNVARQ